MGWVTLLVVIWVAVLLFGGAHRRRKVKKVEVQVPVPSVAQTARIRQLEAQVAYLQAENAELRRRLDEAA
jgi:cell division protein FtsB